MYESQIRDIIYQVKSISTHIAPLGLKSGGAPRNYRHAAPLGLGVRKGKVMEDRRGWETSPTYSKERSTA